MCTCEIVTDRWQDDCCSCNQHVLLQIIANRCREISLVSHQHINLGINYITELSCSDEAQPHDCFDVRVCRQRANQSPHPAMCLSSFRLHCCLCFVIRAVRPYNLYCIVQYEYNATANIPLARAKEDSSATSHRFDCIECLSPLGRTSSSNRSQALVTAIACLLWPHQHHSLLILDTHLTFIVITKADTKAFILRQSTTSTHQQICPYRSFTSSCISYHHISIDTL